MTPDEQLTARLASSLGRAEAAALTAELARAAGPQALAAVLALLDELAEASPKAAGAALAALPELARHGGLDVVVPWLDLGVALAGSSGAAALRYFKESPAGLALIAPPPARRTALALALELAEHDANVALECFRQAPDLLRVLSGAELKPWVEVGVELARWDYVLGIEFFKQSPAAARVIPLDQVRAWVGFGMKLITRNSLGKPDYIGTLEFFRTSPAILGELEGAALRQAVLDVGSLLADHEPAAAIAWLAEVPALVRRIPSEEWRLRAIRYGALVAEKDAGAALDYLRRCPEILGLLGSAAGAAAAFETWFKGGMEVLEYSAEGARAYFALETRRALASVEQALSGVPLRQVARSLTLFVQALCGRDVTIRSLPEPVEPEQKPARPAVSPDGRTIALPAILRRYPTREENVRLYLVMVAHEAGHLEFGTYDLSLARLADLIEAVRRRSASALQSALAVRHLDDLFRLYPQPGVIRDLWTVLEDARVEHRLRQDYPGLSRDLAALARDAVTTRTLRHGMSVRELVVDALLLRTTAEPDAIRIPEAIADVVERAWTVAQRVFAPGATAEDAVRIADRIYGLLDELLPSASGIEGAASGTATESDVGAGPQASEPMATTYRPVTNWAYRGEMRPELIGAREALDDAQAGASGQAGESAQDEPGLAGAGAAGGALTGGTRHGQEVGGAAGASPPSAVEQILQVAEDRRERQDTGPADGRVFLYEEWDGLIRDYRSAWCRVVERAAPAGDAGFAAETLAAHGPAVRLLRRYFESLRPPGLRRVRGQADGDDLDLDAAVARRADRAAGADAADRIYVRREKREREVAAAFLVDLSGSTSRRIEPDGCRVIDVEKEGLVLLCEALEAVGDQYAVYGYSGRGRRQVDFLVLKDFDERGRGIAGARIGAAAPLQQNRDGAAIRHVTRKLLGRRARLRLLVLLSDGRPLDDGYADEYSLEDTKMALREARMQGVEPFCITVDREADGYLRRMYGEVRFLIIDRAAALPERLPRMYQRLTRS
ncbi:VWA domain-containing protein [Nitrospira sp. Kam-Ns4a]